MDGLRTILTPSCLVSRETDGPLSLEPVPLENVWVGKETFDYPQERTLYTLQFHLLEESENFFSQTGDGNILYFLEIVPADGGWKINSIGTSP